MLTLDVLNRLTNDSSIHDLDVKAAQVLLQIECEIGSNRELTSLKERCLKAVAGHWDDICIADNQVQVPNVDGDALRYFCSLCLENAKHQLDAKKNELATVVEEVEEAVQTEEAPETTLLQDSPEEATEDETVESSHEDFHDADEMAEETQTSD